MALRSARLLTVIVAAVLLVNLLAWLAGDRIFLAEARHMDRDSALRRVGQVSNLLNREAANLQRILLGRAERLANEPVVQSDGLAVIDFAEMVSPAFLEGANIDAYLVADASLTVIFASRLIPFTEIVAPLAADERDRLLGLLRYARPADNGIAGVDVAPGGRPALVAAIAIGNRPRYGWLITRRELTVERIASYGKIIENPFVVTPPAAPGADSREGSLSPVIDVAARQVSWRAADVAGRPALSLAMRYDDSYEQHMTRTLAASRGGVLLSSSVVGALAFSLVRRRQLSRQREAESRREVERVARLAALGELAAGVAHEINNPNGMVRRNLEFVRDVLDDALPLLEEREDAARLTLGGVALAVAREQLPQLLADMTHGSRRIGEIVSDLKDFAREDVLDNRAAFDLNEAVAAAVRLLEGTIRKATDHFLLELQPELPKVTGNLRQIEQVVLNLVQNACQSLPDRSRAVTVTTRCDRLRRRNVVEVIDAGVGISAAHRERIFEPFFTTRRESGGTGLGLSVSLRIVKRHAGTLEVESAPGRGTRVTLELPIDEVSR